jgi:hypothetical protein
MLERNSVNGAGPKQMEMPVIQINPTVNTLNCLVDTKKEADGSLSFRRQDMVRVLIQPDGLPAYELVPSLLIGAHPQHNWMSCPVIRR